MNLRFSENALPRALKCFEVERDHHDEPFSQCLKNLMRWVSRYDENDHAVYDEEDYIRLTPDFCNDYSFGFAVHHKDGRAGIVGGLLFHGYPGDADTTFSVTMDASKAWQIHT